MPWAFIPFLFLLTVSVTLERSIAWDVQSLFIPVSAWVGYRYGSAGVKAVFYACIPLFVFQVSDNIGAIRFRFGADGGTVLAALAFAWLLASPRNPAALMAYLGGRPRRLWWLLAVPLTYYAPGTEGFRFVLNSFLSVAAGFFIIGLVYPREDFRRLWKVVAGMFVVGVAVYAALAAAGGRGRLDTEFGQLAYAFFAPQDVASVVIFLFAGYWCRRYARDGTLPRGPFSRGTPTLLIAMMIFGYLQIGLWPGFGNSVGLTGDVYVATLSCLLAGLFYRKRGFLIVLAPALVLTLLSPVFEELTGLGRNVLPGGGDIYVWTRSPERAVTNLVAFFLWTCVGAQLRALMREDRPRPVASAAPAPAGTA